MEPKLALSLAKQFIPNENDEIKLNKSKKVLGISKSAAKDLDTNNDKKISQNELKEAFEKDLIEFDPINKKISIAVPLKIFKTEDEKGDAEKFLDRSTNGAFNSSRTVEDQFRNIKPINLQGYNANFSELPIDDQVADINMGDLTNINNTEDFMNAVRDSIKTDPKFTALHGNNASEEQVNQYIKDNLNSIAQVLGDEFPYEGLISLSGDTDVIKTLQQGSGVCNDIHAVATSLRNQMGQEAYLVHTTGNDASHLYTIFKEDGKWNIQNYGRVIETDASTIAELYDQVMPSQRKIKIYDVESDGNVKQKSTDHLTALGLAEARFKGEAGVGNYNPWTSEDGIRAGNGEISIAKNGLYLGFDPRNNTGRMAYYKKSEEGDTQKIEGTAIEGQYYKNENGFEKRNLDAKYEFEKRHDNADNQTFGREHFSAFVGIEGNVSPVYWGNVSDGTTPVAGANALAGRFGVQWSRNDSKLHGNGDLKFELGHQTKLGTTITFDAKDPTNPEYIGRIIGDTSAESKVVTGAFYQPNKNLTLRVGLATGVDLTKLDGITEFGEQAKNIIESDAYLDLSYGKGPVAVKAMGFVPIHNPTQYKVATGVAFAPSEKFAIGVNYQRERIINDDIDYLNANIEIRPTENMSITGGISTPIAADNEVRPKGQIGLKLNF